MTVPNRLKRNGRPLVPDFKSDERLYLRIVKANYAGDRLQQGAFDMPVQSVNRGMFSEPEDVLLPDKQKRGIAYFLVEHIPKPTVSRDHPGKIFALVVKHAPEEDNYAHSEIHASINGTLADKKSIPSYIRKQFRTDIFLQATVHKVPEE
jgi:hypothetical protein